MQEEMFHLYLDIIAFLCCSRDQQPSLQFTLTFFQHRSLGQQFMGTGPGIICLIELQM